MHVFAATEIAAALLQLTVSPGLAGRFFFLHRRTLPKIANVTAACHSGIAG